MAVKYSAVSKKEIWREVSWFISESLQNFPVPQTRRIQMHCSKNPSLRTLVWFYVSLLIRSCNWLPRKDVHLEVQFSRPHLCKWEKFVSERHCDWWIRFWVKIKWQKKYGSCEPGGQENHSRRRFLSHLALDPRLPSAWANNAETIGKGNGEVTWALTRRCTARDKNWKPICFLASSMHMAPVQTLHNTVK